MYLFILHFSLLYVLLQFVTACFGVDYAHELSKSIQNICLIYSVCVPCFVSDPFAAVFGNETFGGGFADFSSLAKVSIFNANRSPVFWLYYQSVYPHDLNQAEYGLQLLNFSFAFQSNGSDPFDSSTNKNLFKEDAQSDVPPALPPKTGTPTRPPPPPPGKVVFYQNEPDLIWLPFFFFVVL